MLETGELILAGGALFIAAGFQAFVGFGFNLLSLPLLVLLMPVKLAVIMLVIPGWVASGTAAYHVRDHTPWRPVGRFLLITPVGLAAGVWALQGVSPWILEAVLILMLVQVLIPSAGSNPLLKWLQYSPVSAFFAGVGAGSLGTAGPPVVAWAHAKEEWPLPTRRAATLMVFAVINPMRLPFYFAAGLMNDSVIWVGAALSVPVIILGSKAGAKVAENVSERATGIALKVAILMLALAMTAKTLSHALGSA